MTRADPSLLLLRLVVTRHGRVVYDQFFHAGVNIIRGTNSHGKSSIADFIFYALGGEVRQWKPEAGTCDAVFAEVRLNDAVLTLKREVTDLRSQPMHVFFGDYTAAAKSAITGWKVFPYRRTNQTESFSQVLFRALQMPETQGEGASNITMHQLLRLMYVDQLTTPNSLFRDEQFDTGLIRRTVLDYLLGIFDNALYHEELELREAKRQLDLSRGQLKQLESALDQAEIDTDPKKLAARAEKTTKELAAVDAELDELQQKQQAGRAAQKNETAPVAAALADIKRERYVLTNEVQELSLEVEDSRQFIAALERRIAALADAEVTREVLGSLPLHFCPQCLAPLSPATVTHLCGLCKQDLQTGPARSHAARMRQEIALQIKESKGLLDEKIAGLASKTAKAERLAEQVRLKQSEFDRLAQTVQTSRDQKIDTLFQRKGALERALEDFLQKNKIVQVLAAHRQQEKALALRVQELGISITRRQSDQKARYLQAEAVVQSFTLDLLRKDLALEESFKAPQSLVLDPENNTFALDGRNQFSASSIIYLKNSVHFALLFASLELAFLRYPRFLLCDNIEDKGMTTERSRNFQRNIVALSQAAKVEHQIIFTTSMIAPELDVPEFTIGPNYVDGHKTLDLQAAVAASQPTT